MFFEFIFKHFWWGLFRAIATLLWYTTWQVNRDVHCEILLSNLSVLIYITPVVVLVCYICDTYSRFFCANFSLPLFILWLMSVSTSWVLWCEPKTIRNQFFVLFRKYNKTIVNDILRITSKRKKNEGSKKQFVIRERL